jgi:lipoprotein-anchoring transpeptidase ErfK/SrfK
MASLRKITGMVAGAAALGSLGIAVAPSADAATTPCSAQAKACLQLHTNKVWLNGAGPMPVTVGRPGYETPTGTFHVQYKDIDHYSKAYNAPMPYSVFFTTTGIAFHEGSLRVQSHGCVHLSRKHAVEFYRALHPGDVVEVKP